MVTTVRCASLSRPKPLAALRKEVDQARVRRLAWAALGMALFVVAVFQLVPGWIANALGS